MTLLRDPPPRVQCDFCRSVVALTAQKSELFGAELRDLGWRARPIRGRYQHGCQLCAAELIEQAEGRKARAA